MFSTLRTLIRATSAEQEEALIDAQAPRLLAQHLREARTDLAASRRTLAGLVAREKEESRRCEAARDEIARREGEVRAALASDKGDLARDLADRIVTLEETAGCAAAAAADLRERIGEMRGLLVTAERRIASLASDLRAARSAAASRRTACTLDRGPEPGALQRAEEMAGRLRGLTTRLDDQLDALRTQPCDESSDLDSRLRDAGIGNKRDERRAAVLHRLGTPEGKDTE